MDLIKQLKENIEGEEYDALLGAEKIIKNNKDITLAIELKDSEKQKMLLLFY